MAQTNGLGGGIRGQAYLGTNAPNPANVIPAKRDPTADDVMGYAPGTIWINLLEATIWILATVIATVATNGEQQATWYQVAPASSGAVSLIETKTASGVTQVEFTTGINSTYANYMVIFRNITSASASSTDLFIQLSIDGGSSYIATGYRNNFSADNGLQLVNITDGGSICFGTGYLYNLTSGVGYISSNTMATTANPGSISGDSPGNATYETPNRVVNAIRMVTASGGTFNGVISLYSLAQ